MQKFSGWPFLFHMPFIVLSILSSGFDWISIGFYVFIFNCIILIVINMPVILNTMYHLMLPEIITRFPCIFVPWILMHHVEYFKHISLCSLPLGGFPAYPHIIILYILLNEQHIKPALQIVIQYHISYT